MKAILITEEKGLKLSEVPTPAPKSGEVLIRVRAAAVNRADLLQREGSYPPPPGCPDWPGLEIAGYVEKLGEGVTRFAVGDKVCALLGGGGYAEYAAVPEETVMPMPKNLSFEEAAAIPEVYATAYLNLFRVGQAKPGETLLMHAGASGLASAVIPMAKAFGLYVITTVRGKFKAEKIGFLGADRIVDTTAEDIAEVLKEEAENGHPVDIAIDCLGGEALGRCLPHVAFGCRWIQIATLAGDISSINFRTVYVKNIRLIGSTLRSKAPEEKGKLLSELTEYLWSKFESGDVKPVIHAIFPLERAMDAHNALARGENIGKVVLTVE